MKYFCVVLLVLCDFAGLCGAESTNSFGIYVVTSTVDARILAYGTGDWSRVQLAEVPAISDTDIVSYDFINHVMTLRKEALQRIPRPHASGIPFVVMANGERIYLGLFMTLASSMSRAVPSIIVDERMLDTNLPPDTLRISRTYAAPYSETGVDLRSDERIKRALAALHKLK
jgi:hypothetical protein